MSEKEEREAEKEPRKKDGEFEREDKREEDKRDKEPKREAERRDEPEKARDWEASYNELRGEVERMKGALARNEPGIRGPAKLLEENEIVKLIVGRLR